MSVGAADNGRAVSYRALGVIEWRAAVKHLRRHISTVVKCSQFSLCLWLVHRQCIHCRRPPLAAAAAAAATADDDDEEDDDDNAQEDNN